MSTKRERKQRRRSDRDEPSKRDRGGTADFWAWLSSARLAVVLLSVLAVASLVGTLVPQQGLQGYSDEGVVRLYHEKFGTVFGGLMLRLSFHRLYGSTWYVGLLLLLTANTLACAIKSLPRAARRARVPAPATTAERVEGMRACARQTTRMPLPDAHERAAEALRRLGYATAANESPDGARCLVGRRFGWSAWASPALHFSLMLIVIGAVLGRLPGTSIDKFLMLEEGETYHGSKPHPTRYMQGHGLPEGLFDFNISLEDFEMEFYPSGQVSEYTSHLVARRDGEVLGDKRITVNRPLKVESVSFYQSSWGLATLVMGVKRPDGKVQRIEFPLDKVQDPMGHPAWRVQSPAFASVGPEDADWVLFIHDFWQDFALHSKDGSTSTQVREPGPDDTPVNLTQFPRNPAAWAFLILDRGESVQSLGILSRDRPATYEGYEFWLEDVREWSGLSVRKDLGVPVLYAGFVLMVVSMMVALYVAPRTVRVHLSRGKKGAQAVIGGSARPGANFDREFARLRAALQED